MGHSANFKPFTTTRSDHLRLGFPRDDKFESMALEGPGFQRGKPSSSGDEKHAKDRIKDSCIA